MSWEIKLNILKNKRKRCQFWQRILKFCPEKSIKDTNNNSFGTMEAVCFHQRILGILGLIGRIENGRIKPWGAESGEYRLFGLICQDPVRLRWNPSTTLITLIRFWLVLDSSLSLLSLIGWLLGAGNASIWSQSWRNWQLSSIPSKVIFTQKVLIFNTLTLLNFTHLLQKQNGSTPSKIFKNKFLLVLYNLTDYFWRWDYICTPLKI